MQQAEITSVSTPSDTDNNSSSGAERLSLGYQAALIHAQQAINWLDPPLSADWESRVLHVNQGNAAREATERFRHRLQHQSSDVESETMRSKLELFDAWMEEVRQKMEATHPEAAHAVQDLERAHHKLFYPREAEEVPADERPIGGGYQPGPQLPLSASTTSLNGTRYHTPTHPQFRVHQRTTKERVIGFLKKELRSYFPPLDWVPRYPQLWDTSGPGKRKDVTLQKQSRCRQALTVLKGDLLAGATVGAVMIPQAMAYALLAGLSPIVGLYSAFLPCLLYPFVGTSRQLSFGPLALVALLILSAGSKTGAPIGSDTFNQAVIATTFLSGLVLLVAGILRMGFLVNFLSQPVLEGFTCGAAILIAISQLDNLFGLTYDRSPYSWMLVIRFFYNIGHTNWITFLIGFFTIVIIVVGRNIWPSFPGALVVVVLGILISWPPNLSQYGVAVVGTIPSGLPSPAIPQFSYLAVIGVDSILIGMIVYLESVAVAKLWAERMNYEVDANQELRAIGIVNFVGSFFGAMPSGGAIGRSAVLANSGSRSPLAGFIVGLVVMLVLLVLTIVFYHLPLSVLAGVVVAAVSTLVDFSLVKPLWRYAKFDLLMYFIAWSVVLAAGIEWGIISAVIASLLLTVYRNARPHTAVLGREHGTVVYRDTSTHRNLMTIPGIIIYRFEAPIFFGNVNMLRDNLRRLELELSENEPFHAFILDCASVTSIDATGISMLKDIIGEYCSRHILFLMANVPHTSMKTLTQSGIEEMIGSDHFFSLIHDAVLAVERHLVSVKEIPHSDIPEPPLKRMLKKCCVRDANQTAVESISVTGSPVVATKSAVLETQQEQEQYRPLDETAV